MKKLISIVLIAFLFTGCSTTLIKDSSLVKRTVKITLPLGISFEKTTEGLVIGEAELIKEDD